MGVKSVELTIFYFTLLLFKLRIKSQTSRIVPLLLAVGYRTQSTLLNEKRESVTSIAETHIIRASIVACGGFVAATEKVATYLCRSAIDVKHYEAHLNLLQNFSVLTF